MGSHTTEGKLSEYLRQKIALNVALDQLLLIEGILNGNWTVKCNGHEMAPNADWVICKFCSNFVQSESRLVENSSDVLGEP